MKPKSKLIEAAKKDGSMDRVVNLLSGAQLLHCVANMLIEESTDILQQHDLFLGELKFNHNNLVKCADKYFKEFSGLITDEKNKMGMFSDMDEFRKEFFKWAKIPVEWKSNTKK
jgi:hypothetical protein